MVVYILWNIEGIPFFFGLFLWKAVNWNNMTPNKSITYSSAVKTAMSILTNTLTIKPKFHIPDTYFDSSMWYCFDQYWITLSCRICAWYIKMGFMVSLLVKINIAVLTALPYVILLLGIMLFQLLGGIFSLKNRPKETVCLQYCKGYILP